MTIEYNKDLTNLTTFKVPARAAIFAEYASEKDLLALSRTPEFMENEYLHIGSGSNLLFLNPFKGIVLHSLIKGITKYQKDKDTVYVIAG
ncbi:MAG: UDP-N-acetylenolpyruvoylglucosamine reductase, partial [Muribaculaceae bacterium]|nr:UDP-N-acetylenolpyruvoylglucosamine reductase [Muribaculaceae bacterium]